jgi:hypothetical protein
MVKQNKQVKEDESKVVLQVKNIAGANNKG